MSNVEGVGGRRHFSVEEEAALRRDESTASIVKRDAKTNVDISGADLTWPETKFHQQEVGHHVVPLVIEGALTSFEAAEISGAVAAIEHLCHATAVGASVEVGALALGIAAPVVAFGAGVYGLHEAQVKGEEQAKALAQDNAHVALIASLDLPESYKQGRLEGAFKHVARGPNSPAFRATEGLFKDPKSLATLQLHADRGMNASRDMLASKMAPSDYLKAHPEVAKSFAKDAAFREGFQAFQYAKATMSPEQMKGFERSLDTRDGWYAQSQIQFRV